MLSNLKFIQPLSSVLLCVVLACAGVGHAEQEPPRFAIYRVELVPNESAPQLGRQYPDERINSAVTQEYLKATAVRLGEPAITESDIAEYCWASQHIQLTPEGALRWESMGGFNVPLTGLPLQVFVDGEPRYGALLWNPLSSMGSELPQYWCKVLHGGIIIGGRFTTTAGDTIYNESYDPQVKQVMRELGKLTEECEVP